MKNYFELSREIAHLQSAYSLLHWDFETQMPKGAAEWRGESMGHFAGLIHEKSVAPTYRAAALQALTESQDEIEQRALQEAIKDIDRSTLLPQSLVENISNGSAQAHGAWVSAKKENNFALFAPHLEKMLGLIREKARLLAKGGDPYDALLEDFSPGLTSATIESLFNELRPALQALIARRKPVAGRKWSVPIEVQEKICHDVVEWMGFPRTSLTQARSVHPFCTSFHPTDVRITTRYQVEDPLMSILSTVHELGHGLYEHQLPTKYPGTPLIQANGMDLHESQSRLWEVCLATSPEFYRWIHAWFTKHAPECVQGWSADDLYRLGSEVQPSLIRTESDPVTYGMHIMIRFQLERELFAGKLTVTDLPKAWNAAYAQFLGVTPANDSEGILQDSHWSGGAFAYFPSYLLGTMVACQIHAALKDEFKDLSRRVENGDMAPIREWLATNVHCWGRGKSLQDILKLATGSELKNAPFLKLLEERFIS